jgi:hypothetical protein
MAWAVALASRARLVCLPGGPAPLTQGSSKHLAPKVFRLRYRHELDTGATHANAAVVQNLFNLAVKQRNHLLHLVDWGTMGWRGTTQRGSAAD